ncbi:chitin deacetylase 1-like [Ylistrum balloti]|uniref:chitin deacetylase 1-like n=1 Tax=Ylistrum balloti TaxID=509963 RepID=UPI00290583BE|nr:chitin deacetylase 1-like [Ylistrum balloti]
MMFLITITVCVGLGLAQIAEPCDKDACQLPNCRCFSDPDIPGGLTAAETPQIVTISMDYTLNSEYEPLYDQIFVVNNPNGCKITGTFYIQDLNTNYALVKSYHDKKFEIGVSSIDGTLPTTSTEWIELMKSVKDKITTAPVDEKEIYGYRAPQLSPGGDDMFIGLADQALLYDSSCGTAEYASQTTLKWPFTYDYDYGSFTCNGGQAVSLKFPGRWQVLIPELDFNDQKCATPQSCTNIMTKKDAFDILYNNFVKHYDGNRAPYTVVVDPVWMKTDFKLEGLIQFVEYIRAAFDDVWVVTQIQALQWVQNPTPIANLTDFEPWKCT